MTLPNIISLTRVPLSLIFVFASPPLRLVTLGMALLSDGLDGYIARNWNQKSRLGHTIDPLTDKIFVITALATLILEGALTPADAAFFLSRDIALVIFGAYLISCGKWQSYRFRAIYCGKAATLLQFLAICLIVAGVAIPSYIYAGFVLLGFGALIELLLFQDAD